MILRTFYEEALAQTSYLVGCSATGEALVIDPNRHTEQYIQFAQSKGLRIIAVTETHIHADFVSGARELAQKTGAQLYLSDAGSAEWKYAYATDAKAVPLKDGDTFKIGNILMRAVHTPGHTPEHLSFLLTDTAGADEPMGLFTGDFLFVGDVGRPDLLERAAGLVGTMDAGARMLFHSIQKVRELPDYLQIWPGHGAGSACGRALGEVPQSTLGYERRFNWAFSIQDEEKFVKAVLAGQPEPPTYFAQMKRINKAGPAPISLAEPPEVTPAQAQGRLTEGARVVDIRSAEEYATGHVPGTINIPLHGSFLTWAGWLIAYDRPLLLVADPAGASQAQHILSLIGLEHIAGYVPVASLRQWYMNGGTPERIQRIEVDELRQRLNAGDVYVLDVRNVSEYAEGHIEGAHNIPLGYLERRLNEIPTDRTIAVHCQAGTRSAIAVSILAAHGLRRGLDVCGGFAAWEQAGYAN